jgi:hypothetical protein
MARLTLTCSRAEEVRALQKVLAPDNEGGPRELEIGVRISGKALNFQIRSKAPSSAITTVLGILRDVSLFEQIWLLSEGADAQGIRP